MRWRGRIWWLLLGAALATAGAGTWRFATDQDPGLQVGAPWWLAGLVLLALASWWGDRDIGRSRGQRWTQADVLAVLCVAAAAVLYRVWRIAEYPPVELFGFEEFQTGGLAYAFLRHWAWPLEFPLTNVLPGVSFRLFGLSSHALRAPFVLSGVLAPVLLFVALRRLVALPAAWAASMLLATSRWAAVAARFADEIFFPISIVALSLWLLVRVLQGRRQMDAFVLALVMGDLFYAYNGYRVLPLITYAGVGVLAAAQWRRSRLPAGSGRRVVLVTAVWAVLLSPGVVRNCVHGDPVFSDALWRHEMGWQEEDFVRTRLATGIARLRQGWEVFAVRGDEVATTNIPEQPMFDPVTAALATLAVAAAFWRWRDAARALGLTAVIVVFIGVAVIPINFNVARYFVLLVPLFVLVGFFADDLLSWRVLPSVWSRRILVGAVVLAAILNFIGLERLITHPVVRASFVHPENTVLAAVHRVPRGARAIVLTRDGANALEESDYRWFTAHVSGGRPRSLTEALTLRPQDDRPVYWIIQGRAEADLLPALVRLVCPQARSTVFAADHPVATVGVAWVPSGEGCTTWPHAGMSAAYVVRDRNGATREIRQIDAALMAYTIPWPLAWELQDGQIAGLQVDWSGRLLPKSPGNHELRLELLDASGVLRVRGAAAEVTAAAEVWSSARQRVAMGAESVAVSVTLRAEAGASPRVRLWWTPPGELAQIIPPSHLRPN